MLAIWLASGAPAVWSTRGQRFTGPGAGRSSEILQAFSYHAPKLGHSRSDTYGMCRAVGKQDGRLIGRSPHDTVGLGCALISAERRRWCPERL